jgi:carboxyl-terminal processing protease
MRKPEIGHSATRLLVGRPTITKYFDQRQLGVELGKKNNIKPDLKDLQLNKKLFQVYLKAEIARKVWGNSAFYPIFNETNEVLQQAIKLFDRIPDLDKGKM